MTIDTNAIVSMTEANQNFSRVTRIAEQKGQAVIFKNNRPKYLLLDLDNAPSWTSQTRKRSTSQPPAF